MPLTPPELRATIQRVLVSFLVILVPLSAVGFYLAQLGDSHVRHLSGNNIRSVTRTSADLISNFIGERVRDVSVIANNPTFIDAVTVANRQYEPLSAEAITTKVAAIEQKWNSPESDVLARSILTSDQARQLRRMRELNPTLLKITVADSTGAAVAATDKPLHYFQTDRDYWTSLYSQGQGAIHVSDLRYDDQSRLYYLGIAYPILQEGTGRFAGAVTALADVSPLFNQLTRQQIARTGRVFLVRDDGTVVLAPGISPALNMRSEEYAAIRDSLGNLRGREAGYLFATLSNGQRYLIGFADTGLKEAYPNLPWVVLASQDEREVLGPIFTMAGYMLFLTILSMLVLILLAAYVFLHRRPRLEDIETPPEDKARPAAA